MTERPVFTDRSHAAGGAVTRSPLGPVPTEPARVASAVTERPVFTDRSHAAGGADTPAPLGPVPTDPARVASAVTERPVFTDRSRRLFGVLAEPEGPASGRAILLLNAGAVHHVGPNRLYTRLARRWAGLGHHVLRADLTGIGDSPARPGEPENVVYGRRAAEDVAALLRWLWERPGIRDVQVLGLCSGGYHAFKTAVAGERVDGIVVINPLTFFWKEGQSLDVRPFEVVSEAERYSRAAADPDKWRKLLRGDVDVRAAVRTLARHARSRAKNQARDVARRVGLSWGDDLATELLAVANRRIPLRFLFSGGDPGVVLLRDEGGSTVRALERRGALSIHTLDGPDHTFTPVWSHAALERALGELLDRLPAPGP